MRSIAKVFGRSPFIPLQTHMEKVAECVEKLPEVLAAYQRGDSEKVLELSKAISKLEHEADLIKDDIRNSLPRGIFLPVDRANLLAILSNQDTLADRAENIAVLLTFKQVKELETLRAPFERLVAKCLEAFQESRRIIGELDELLETGFGGTEASKVKEMVSVVGKLEYEADVIQRDLVRELLRHEQELSYGDFFVWMRIIRQLSQLADGADNLASTIRMTLESK